MKPVQTVVSERWFLRGKNCRNDCIVHTICFKRKEPYRQVLILGIPLDPVDVVETVFCFYEDCAIRCWHLCLSSLAFLQEFCSISVLPGVLS